MGSKSSQVSKRQAVRIQRQQRERRQRLLIVLLFVGAALIVMGVIVIPQIIAATAPIGEIKSINPIERPMVDGRALGKADAPVLVEAFVDFQCPACRSYAEMTEKQLAETYIANGQVRYIFKHFPFLDNRAPGNESDQAANASMCAVDQGRFWDFHDILFANWDGENEGSFSNKRLVAFAENLGLDMTAFKACFEENKYKDQIDQDYDEGRARGVTGTPTVFVNGEIITPGFVPTFEQLKQVIDSKLQ